MALYCPKCGTAHAGNTLDGERVCACGYSAGAARWLWLPREDFFREWKKRHGDKPIPEWVSED
jgi:hypothetical protein